MTPFSQKSTTTNQLSYLSTDCKQLQLIPIFRPKNKDQPVTPCQPPAVSEKCVFPDWFSSGCWRLLSLGEIGSKEVHGAALKTSLASSKLPWLPVVCTEEA